jgi:Tfp pilus assembly protein FimT
VIDNEELAKAWYAFIGYSNAALSGRPRYFEEGTNGVYHRVFKSVPINAFWSAFSVPSYKPDFDTYFEPGTPSAYQYLLAFGIAEYIDAMKVSTRLSKKKAIKRGILNGELKGDPDTGRVLSSNEKQSAYLNEDVEYNVDKMIAYMREVLIELFSFVLTKKYASCDPSTCQKIISSTLETEFFRTSFEADVLSINQNGSSILGPTYQFLKDCIKSYYFANHEEMRAAARLRAYLARRTTINKLRRLIVKRDKRTRDWDDPIWKLRGETFFESLPELS